MATERIDIVVTENGSRVVQRNIRDIGGSARTSASGVDFLKRTLAGLGIAFGVREIIQGIDAYNNLQNRLRSTGLEGKNLTGVYQALLKASNDTRSSVEGSVELYSRLAISSKELGVSQQGLIGFTKSLNQAILLSGASATEAQAGLIQLSQGMASGTLRGDELRSVLEQLPAVADVIAKHLGVTRGELRQMGQDGKITAQTILAAFEEAGPALNERFGKTIPTIGQSFQILKNSVTDLFGKFNEATGITGILSKALVFLANNLETIVKAVVSLAAGWVIVQGGVTAFNAVRNAVLLLNAAIAANPIGFLLVVLTSAITALTLFRDQIKLGTNEATTLGDLMRAVGEKIGAALKAIWEAAKAVFGPLIQLIEDWVGKVDFSLAGILKFVAKAVDLFFGAWFGTIGAVIELFKGFGPAISDLVTTALNKILGKIGDFVNSAGELLSSVTEFAGLGKIATVDLRLTNENEGAAKKLGQNIGNAFKIGLENSTAQDFVQGLFDRADQIGAERVKREAAAAAQVSDTASPAVALPKTGDEDAKKKKTRDLAEELKNLVTQYDRVYAAQQELAAAEKLLSEAQAAGLISAERKAEVLGLVNKQLQDQLDPLGAVNRELDKQQDLLKLTADAREIEAQMQSLQQSLQASGITLTETENKALRERLKLIQDETKATQARDAVLQAIKGPQEETMNQIKAIQDLIKSGQVTQGEANAYFVAQNAELMAGTAEARQADLFNLEAYYKQVDQWRQADLVSATTAAKLKADAESTYNLKKLEGAQKFFGTLAGLSRSENRKLAAIGKAAAVAQATIDGFAAVQAALKGPPGPPWSYAIAAATAAVAGANVAAIVNQPLPGFAFGGQMRVNGVGGTDSQTVAFRATPGETVKVSTPAQDREDARREQQGAAQTGGNTTVVNVVDPNLLQDYLTSPGGERILLNVLQRNQGRISQLARG